MIIRDTTLEELAVLISQALSARNIVATLSGGSAVSIYANNEYESADLDFVTSSPHSALANAIKPLGFRPTGNTRLFEHPNTEWLVEFPPGPLAFGLTSVQHEDVPVLATRYGPLRIITPTLSVLDRLAAYYYFKDNPSWDQAVMVAKHQKVNWADVYAWAENENQSRADVDRLKRQASSDAGLRT